MAHTKTKEENQVRVGYTFVRKLSIQGHAQFCISIPKELYRFVKRGVSYEVTIKEL